MDIKHYSWVGVIDFVQEAYEGLKSEKQQWNYEKKLYEEKASYMATQITELENQNKELCKKVKSLELALRQQRISAQRGSMTSSKKGENKVQLNKYQKLISKQLSDLGIEKPVETAGHRPTKSFGGMTRNIRPTSPKEAPPIEQAEIIAEPKVAAEKRTLSIKFNFQSHFDSVRWLEFLTDDKTMISASEDYSIKLWDLNVSEFENIEPTLTLRGHKSPVLGLTSRGELIYSASADGEIVAWNIADVANMYSSHASPYISNQWTGHENAIWSLQHHLVDPLLLSCAADNKVCLWNTTDPTQMDSAAMIWERDGLTKSTWVQTELNNFASGTSASGIYLYNLNSPQALLELKSSNSWTNTIVTSPTANLLISGHEDQKLRFYDISSGKLLKEMIGHSDAVSTLSIDSSGVYAFSGSHDGSLRVWDIRKYKCLYETPCHRKKFDESVNVVVKHPNLPILATGGADSLVKVFQTNNFGVND